MPKIKICLVIGFLGLINYPICFLCLCEIDRSLIVVGRLRPGIGDRSSLFLLCGRRCHRRLQIYRLEATHTSR